MYNYKKLRFYLNRGIKLKFMLIERFGKVFDWMVEILIVNFWYWDIIRIYLLLIFNFYMILLICKCYLKRGKYIVIKINVICDIIVINLL